MPGRYGSRATKFLYLDGARMTGADGPLTKSESETELLTEKFMPEGSKRPVVVHVRSLKRDRSRSRATPAETREPTNLILSDDAHALAATPERVVTVGDFGDIVGQKATIYRAMSLAEAWKTIPGELLLQFSGMLKTARGQAADVREGRIIRAMAQSTGANNTGASAQRALLVDLGSGSSNGFAIGYHIEQIEFKDRASLTLGISHANRHERNAGGDCRFKRRHPHHGRECHPRPVRLLAYEGRDGP